MKTVLRAVAGTLLAIVAVLGILSAVWSFVIKGSMDGDSLSIAIANGVLDASGIKGQVDSSLRDRAPSIAAATGMNESQVQDAIDTLAIESWSVCALPADAESTGSFSTQYAGGAATVTTYADPSYVTVSSLGQELTLAVPASAQGYVSLLGYL